MADIIQSNLDTVLAHCKDINAANDEMMVDNISISEDTQTNVAVNSNNSSCNTAAKEAITTLYNGVAMFSESFKNAAILIDETDGQE
ncbi:MAG: TIGR04197 family type VII secretion effector [Faecalibacterium sp.]